MTISKLYSWINSQKKKMFNRNQGGWIKIARVEDITEATARIEAALYSAGRPLRIEDIVRASGTESRTKTLDLLETIMKKTKTAFKALEIVILPDGTYVMQL